MFQCKGYNIEWLFNLGCLPPGVLVSHTLDQSILTIVVHNDSYYGRYQCDGDLDNTDKAFTSFDIGTIGFYDIGSLQKHCELILCLFNYSQSER